MIAAKKSTYLVEKLCWDHRAKKWRMGWNYCERRISRGHRREDWTWYATDLHCLVTQRACYVLVPRYSEKLFLFLDFTWKFKLKAKKQLKIYFSEYIDWSRALHSGRSVNFSYVKRDLHGQCSCKSFCCLCFPGYLWNISLKHMCIWK